MSDQTVGFLGGERGYTAKIQDCIDRAKHEFIFIGLLLCEVDEYGYYQEAGFSDVYEYCEVTFGFKRSSTNNFMRVYRKFGEAMGLQERYKGYSYSQLTEMCSMNDYQLSRCDKAMSVQRLRELKKAKYQSVISLGSGESSIQTSGSEDEMYTITVNNIWVDIPKNVYKAFFDCVKDKCKCRFGSCHDVSIVLHKNE